MLYPYKLGRRDFKTCVHIYSLKNQSMCCCQCPIRIVKFKNLPFVLFFLINFPRDFKKANYSSYFAFDSDDLFALSLFPSRMCASPLFTVQIDVASSYWSIRRKNSSAIGYFYLSQDINVTSLIS